MFNIYNNHLYRRSVMVRVLTPHRKDQCLNSKTATISTDHDFVQYRQCWKDPYQAVGSRNYRLQCYVFTITIMHLNLPVINHHHNDAPRNENHHVTDNALTSVYMHIEVHVCTRRTTFIEFWFHSSTGADAPVSLALFQDAYGGSRDQHNSHGRLCDQDLLLFIDILDWISQHACKQQFLPWKLL